MNKAMYAVGLGVLKPRWVQARIVRLAPKLQDNKQFRTTELTARDRRIIKENL